MMMKGTIFLSLALTHYVYAEATMYAPVLFNDSNCLSAIPFEATVVVPAVDYITAVETDKCHRSSSTTTQDISFKVSEDENELANIEVFEDVKCTVQAENGTDVNWMQASKIDSCVQVSNGKYISKRFVPASQVEVATVTARYPAAADTSPCHHVNPTYQITMLSNVCASAEKIFNVETSYNSVKLVGNDKIMAYEQEECKGDAIAIESTNCGTLKFENGAMAFIGTNSETWKPGVSPWIYVLSVGGGVVLAGIVGYCIYRIRNKGNVEDEDQLV